MNIKNKIQDVYKVFYRYENNNILIATFWNSLYLAFFLLPLGINLPTPFFIISIILGSVNIFRSNKKFVLDNKSLLLLPLYFVITSLSLFYTENISDGLDLVQRSLSLLLFPLIFLFVKEDASSVKKLFDFLLFGLLVSFFMNLFILFNDAAYSTKIDFNSVPQTLISGWDYFIGAEFSKLMNPSYLSLYILLVLSYYLKKKIDSKLRTIIVSILFVYLFLLGSKAAYLILFIMSVLLLFNVGDKAKKHTLWIVFVLSLIIFSNNPKVFNFYKTVTYFESSVEHGNSTLGNPKLLSWDASIKLIKDAPLLGYGVGDANDVLAHKYAELGYDYNYENRYNAHNQFFQTLLQTGVLGFGILLVIFAILALRMKRSSNEFSVFLILLISLVFESMLVRFNGIVFFSIIVPLLLKKRSILSSRIIRNTTPVKDVS